MMEKHRFNQSSPSPSQEPTKNAAQEQTQQHGQEHHSITPSRSKYGATFLSVALPISLLAGYWCNRPFSQVLATKTVSIAALSSAQKLNIENAVSRLDTIVLKPGEVFHLTDASVREVRVAVIFRRHHMWSAVHQTLSVVAYAWCRRRSIKMLFAAG